MKLYKGGTRPGLTCFLYMLWRAAYPTTLLKDEMLWGETRGDLCDMINIMIKWVYLHWAAYLVHDLNVDAVRWQCRKFAAVIAAMGAPLWRCWGFIDGTIRKTCRLTVWQGEA